MVHTDLERIAVAEFNKRIFLSIKDGSLSEEIFNSSVYIRSQQLMLVLIILLEPLSYKEIKDIVIMVFNAFLSLVDNTHDFTKEIDNTWSKYKKQVHASYKIMQKQQIGQLYDYYELKAMEIKLSNGLSIPISKGAFNEIYQNIDPTGFPLNFKELLLALNKFNPEDNHDSKTSEKTHLLKIQTRSSAEDIMDFWIRLNSNNEKGEPYWESEKEIEHFVFQNFDVFPGVDEIKEFSPNMNKTELSQVVWTFYRNHGMSKSKKQYEKLLMQNFTKFKHGKKVYSNIKDGNNEHLTKLFK